MGIKNMTVWQPRRMYYTLERYPHYTSQNSTNRLNKIHWDLGFIKLVSRIKIMRSELSGLMLDFDRRMLINKYTGGRLGTYIGENHGQSGLEPMQDMFLGHNDQLIGNAETGWWFYQNNLIVTPFNAQVHAIELNRPAQEYFGDEGVPKVDPKWKYGYSFLSPDKIVVKKGVLGDWPIYEHVDSSGKVYGGVHPWVKATVGFSHRSSARFVIGDKIYNEHYMPTWHEVKPEWVREFIKLKHPLSRDANIAAVIPSNEHGQMPIQNFDDMLQSARNYGRSVS